MSLATRCPACGTTFRIEPEQLALADGWARCGRCSAVFDAAEAQRPELADAASAPLAPASTSAATPVPNDMDAFGAALLNFHADRPAPSSDAGGAPDASDDAMASSDASLEPSATPAALSPSAPLRRRPSIPGVNCHR